jgi:hypothetical protein
MKQVITRILIVLTLGGLIGCMATYHTEKTLEIKPRQK